MTDLQKLIDSYKEYIAIPWRADTAAPQRVIFCIYHPGLERTLCAKLDEFELAARQENHSWAFYDLTNAFPGWLSGLKYKESYFQNPDLVYSVLPKFLDFIDAEFQSVLSQANADGNCVAALHGVGTLFGFLKVKDLVDRLAPYVMGRLLVFFPGSYENNNYRLLDGYDGWNYHAVAITGEGDI